MTNPKFKDQMYVPNCCVWEITRGCNMRCLHCGASAGAKRSKELTTDEALKVCEQLRDIGTGEISLIGGEVFVRRDWFLIAQKIRSLGMNLVIITNNKYFLIVSLTNFIYSSLDKGCSLSLIVYLF